MRTNDGRDGLVEKDTSQDGNTGQSAGFQEDEKDRAALKRELEKAKGDLTELGGWEALKSGDWLLRLIQRSFKAYYTNANEGYFRAKYPKLNADQIANKLVSVASRNASLLGIVVGATISADEIVTVLTGGEGGVGLPANIAIGVASVGAEVVLLARFQLQLVANLAKLYGVPLDPDDPEDILVIFAFAVGGSVAELAGKLGAKVGGRLTERMVRKYVSKEVLEAIKSLGRKIGIKILQRTIIKYAVPVASMGIGGVWNYFATKAVGKIARKHFLARMSEMESSGESAPGGGDGPESKPGIAEI